MEAVVGIYATWLSLDDDGHEVGCARWVRCSAKHPEARMQTWDGKHFREDNAARCTCGNDAPLIYQGSHINPDETDPRGGYLFACAIPNHCHPSVRMDANTDEGVAVEYLRLSMGEHHTTYHGMEPGHATLVLEREHVERLRDTLTTWLDSRERA